MANGYGLSGHRLKKSVGNAYVSQGTIRRQVLHIDQMAASAHDALCIIEMERLDYAISAERERLAGIREIIRASASFGNQASPGLEDEARKSSEMLEMMLAKYNSSPCSYTPLEGAAFEDHVAAVQAHNNHFNSSRGHKYRHSDSWKRPRKRRAGTGYSFKPEIPSLPSGAGNFFSQDGMYISELGDVWDLELEPRYSRKSGSHPEQARPKIEWDSERQWRNRRSRRLGTAKKQEIADAIKLNGMRKSIKWFSTPDCKPPSTSGRKNWWFW